MRFCRRSSRPANEINQICDGIRISLEQRNLRLYINSVLTAYVLKSPPDVEGALKLLARLQGMSLSEQTLQTHFHYPGVFKRLAEFQDSVEDAVKYIIFLVDADTLFDTALGMYDFPLTLLIAQHSQRACRHTVH